MWKIAGLGCRSWWKFKAPYDRGQDQFFTHVDFCELNCWLWSLYLTCVQCVWWRSSLSYRGTLVSPVLKFLSLFLPGFLHMHNLFTIGCADSVIVNTSHCLLLLGRTDVKWIDESRREWPKSEMNYVYFLVKLRYYNCNFK